MIEANNPKLTSWVEIPEGSDFPIQNLPFGIFKPKSGSARAGVAIGEMVLDLSLVMEEGLFGNIEFKDPSVFHEATLNDFIALGRPIWRKVRNRTSELLQTGNDELKNHPNRNSFFYQQSEVRMQMPVRIGDYTDFYSSEQHATNVGTMFRDPKNALLPNWKHLPVGYHGRSSSIVVSGTPLKRPKGQTKLAEAELPIFGPTNLLDFELEMAFIVGKSTKLGESISTEKSEEHIFGFVIFNDWSARDIQTWEYVPLGPFLAKNFGSSISPWIVTLDALEPYRVPGPNQVPKVLPYLEYSGNHHFDIELEVAIAPKGKTETIVTKSNFKYMYWNICQQLAHHTVNGCNMNVGDMMASGTISGPTEGSYGSMLEITWRGTKPVKMKDGSERKFIQDGDAVVMRAYNEKNGVRIGFGQVSCEILPAD